MKNSKIVGVFLLIAILIQNVYFLKTDSCFIYTFAFSLNTESNIIPNAITIMILLAPVFFIHFYFSEAIYRLTHGYGKIYIIRKYSKTKLLMKEIGKILIQLICIVCIQTALAYLFKGELNTLKPAVIAASICSYFLGIFAVVLLQMYLEFRIAPQQAAIVSCVYAFVSYYAGAISTFIPNSYLIKLIFFPCLLFGSMNGANENIWQYIVSICYLMILCIGLVFANIHKLKKSDIF